MTEKALWLKRADDALALYFTSIHGAALLAGLSASEAAVVAARLGLSLTSEGVPHFDGRPLWETPRVDVDQVLEDREVLREALRVQTARVTEMEGLLKGGGDA